MTTAPVFAFNKSLFHTLFSFKGRCSRLDIGAKYLPFLFVFIITIYYISNGAPLAHSTSIPLGIIHLWTISAVGVKRCHDIDITGWFLLCSFIPLFQLWVFFILIFRDGTQGPNRFGVDPKGRTSAVM